MCRKKKTCSELSTNIDSWSKEAPLVPLEWFESQLDIFERAVEMLVAGQKKECIKELARIRNEEMKAWFMEHGQMSGDHRARQINLPKPIAIDESLRDTLRNPKKHEAEVFARDGYRCRYCGIRLLSNKFLTEFIKTLNGEAFQKGRSNSDRHGIIHIFNPVADHVVPWSQGGRTNLENLVTSCGPCNYGKAGHTIERLGISNPLSRPPKTDNWDGLLSKIALLKKV